MTGVEASVAPYPAQLLDWAGNRSGGVRRLFDKDSGRPGGMVFRTNLLHRLEEWARSIATGVGNQPRILLLVGGPGNGKTEAIESTVGWLDEHLKGHGNVVADLRRSFFPPDGIPVPRLVKVEAPGVGPDGNISLSIVQDASTVVGSGSKQAAQLLLDELEAAQSAGKGDAYLCCVNRGVLDDALIEAIDSDRNDARTLLESVTTAVSLAPDAPSCWPLAGFADVAVWPMDAESLLQVPLQGGQEPARALLEVALDQEKWLPAGECTAGDACPFCGSRERLSQKREKAALLQVLRWYEVASGKRWSFRDLFSLSSYLLAGHRVSPKDAGQTPCEWASKQEKLDEQARSGAKPSKEQSTAIFNLVAAQYQHALFHWWDRDSGPSLLRDMRDLELGDDNTAMGLAWFLNGRRSTYLPAMISASLDGIAELLDPALTDPNTEVQATNNTRFALREVDVRFSRSVLEGVDYVRRLKILTKAEIDLLDRLAKLDATLSVAGVRRGRPATATSVQRFIRDFGCRLVRRSLGARTAEVLDAPILSAFQHVIEDTAGDDLFDVALDVGQLLNNDRDFEISLTTTFGQPLPPAIKRAMLVVPSRLVKPMEQNSSGRPASPICFLMVGDGKSGQPIALTYDLFKAVKELHNGMSVASLPRTVLALLDTTRARLSGPIVRDALLQDQARIKIGTSDSAVVKRRHGFGTRREGSGR
ncbi:hypothetical protein WBP07_01500 [Novosphingobium sp. BL-8A]|uniref:hypothetical protein n=1 Tax=Novosphingobium sp. BL-8A TaxID=3127639 RepID=UPI003756C6D2